MTAALPIVAGAVGLAAVGPALNMAVLRWFGRCVVVPALMGWAPSWHQVAPAPACCPWCGRSLELAVTGRLSLLPWVLAGGRCRTCGAWHPRWMAGVEVATGALFALAAARLGWSAELPAVLALLAGLVAVSVVDLACLRIPTPFVHATAATTLVAIAAAAVAAGPADALVGAAIGAAFYGGFLGLFHLASPAHMGLGDVRLGGLIGAVVGWLAWAPDQPVEGPVAGVLGAALIAGLVGTVSGAVLLVVRRQSRPFPFGPAMAVGAVAAVLLGP